MSDLNLKYRFYSSIWTTLDLLIPPLCGGCGKPGRRWCEKCQKEVQVLNGPLCDVCGLPQERTGVRNACLAERPHFRSLRSWAVFENPVRNALHKLKYRRDVSLGDTLATEMMPFVKGLNWPIEVIIPIPLGKLRYKERGYNQVGMVALPLALALKVVYLPHGLRRHKETRSQVGLTRKERRENVHKAFLADSRVNGKSVLVMDDVATTGSILSSSAEALVMSGVKEVYALAVARALPHHGLNHA